MFQSRNAGSQPGVVPAAEGRVGVVVVAREALAQVGRLSRHRAPSRCSRPRRPRRRGAARPRRRRRPGERAACSSAIEPPSLWPKSQGRSMPSAAKSAGSTSSRLAVHEVERPALVGRLRRRAAVAVAREDEAAQAVRIAEARAGSPSTSRPSRALRAGRRRPARRYAGAPTHSYSMSTARPRQRSTTATLRSAARSRIAASRPPARARAAGSAGSCRSPSSAARRGTR